MKTPAIRHVGFEHLALLENVLVNHENCVRNHDAGAQQLDNIDATADHISAFSAVR